MKIKYVMALAAAMFLSACSSEVGNVNDVTPENGTENPAEEEQQQEKRKLQVVEDEVAPFDATQYQEGLTQAELEVAAKLRNMDIRLSTSVMEGEQGNMVLSPYSLHQVLAMAMNATSDEALSELMQQYGLTHEDMELVNTVFRKQRNLLVGQQTNTSTLEVANKLWLDYSIPVFRSYMTLLQNFYDAETEAIDCFSEEGSGTVNKWVEENTHGLIRNVVDKTQTGWVANLMNTIYMKAEWTTPFMEQNTSRMKFQNQDGSESKVDMMHQLADLPYAKTEYGCILRMPLGKGRQYEADFILPAEGIEAGTILANLDGMLSQCAEERVDLLMPKQKIYNKMVLNDCLYANGLAALFYTDAYTRFSPAFTLLSSKIQQHACFEFSESGVEGAAMTEGHYDGSTGEGGGITYIPFYMNRPFLFFVRNQQHNTLLFVGKVCQIGN